MLDAQHAVVSISSQHGHERLPELIAVAVAAGAKRPGAMLEVAVVAGVEVAVDRTFNGVKLGILSVHVVQQLRLTQPPGSADRVDPLPEEMGWIQVGAERRLCSDASRLRGAL